MIPWWAYAYLGIGLLIAAGADRVANVSTPYWFKYRLMAWVIVIVFWLPLMAVVLSKSGGADE